MKSKVSLVKSESRNVDDVKQDVSSALNLIDFKLPSSVKTAVIKVNLCYYWNASTGYTTDPVLVEAIIDYIREKCGNNVEIKIAEADASAMKTKYAFQLLGYNKLAKQKNVHLLNLTEDIIKETEIQVANQKMSLQVPQSLLTSDLFINVPKLKVMRRVFITCAMKNLFGAIAFPRKVTYHPLLEETIVAINKVLKPHLNIVDAKVALGRHPIRLNLLMASESAFSADWISAQVAGYNPSKIKFLKLAKQEKLGDSRDVVPVGEPIRLFKAVFPTENHFITSLKAKMQVSMIKAYSAVSGDVIPPSLDDM
jgi:uncharacterized protein (DUF362 family)